MSATTETRTIGVIGGMAWESSAVYYRLINEKIAERLGGRHSARLLLNSTDFEEIEQGGAECVLIACVTQHEVAAAAAAAIGVPFIHIADVTGDTIKADGRTKIGLLGTRFTMEREFFTGRLRDNYGLDVLLPDEPERAYLHETIFEEFANGVFTLDTKERYLKIIRQLMDRGAEGIVLGCTEIGMLVNQQDIPEVPLYDTTALHVEAAVEFSLGIRSDWSAAGTTIID